MTRVVLAGGGTAGHVNPLLAVAAELVASQGVDPSDILVIGTSEGLESRLVPAAGFALSTIARLPMPRKISVQAVTYWPRFVRAVFRAGKILRTHRADVVVGFGGYACAPAYVAAWLGRTPLVIHEANAIPGFANRVGAKLTKHIVTTFASTELPGSVVVGMPMSRAMTDRALWVEPALARKHFGLTPDAPTLVVTGGSQGSRAINHTVVQAARAIIAAGWQILHIVGGAHTIPVDMPQGYVGVTYCDRMDLAFAAATCVVSRAGSATVSEIQLRGLPALFVPYPVGNGEQKKNAAESVASGGALMVSDADFTEGYVLATLIPLLNDDDALARMRARAQGLGKPDAAASMATLILDVAHSGKSSAAA